MTQKALADMAGVSEADVSNYRASMNGQPERLRHISRSHLARIEAAIEAHAKISKTRLVEMHLERGDTITPAQAFTRYSLHSLGQRITDLNRRYERDHLPKRIVNIRPLGSGQHAEYRMESI